MSNRSRRCHPFRTTTGPNPAPSPAGPVTQPSTTVTPGRHAWTPDQVRALGMTTDLETAAAIIGIGRTLAYELARTGDFPVRRLQLGRRVLVPVADLLAYLGAEPPDGP